jgi:hypothetical protein
MSAGAPRPPLPAALLVPHRARLDPRRADYARILARHAEAIAAGRDFYLDPATGLQVMTAQFLWDHGNCCEAGCRHCPYLPRDAT